MKLFPIAHCPLPIPYSLSPPPDLFGNGSEERDKTPLLREEGDMQKPGKFWIYEQVIRPAFYGIYEVSRARIEVYHFNSW